VAWPTPQFSKTQVNKAGQILVDLRKYDLSDRGDLRTVASAFEVVSNWRSCHGYPINTFQATLRNKLRPIAPKAIVAQRLKRITSIIGKLRRFPNMKLSTMQDIGGLRAVVSPVVKVRSIEKAYRQSRFQHHLVKVNDYIASPKDSGYRSVHLVYRYKNARRPEYDGLLVELQIRTQVQHAFATAVETAETFVKSALKSSEGPSEWLDFFSLAGSAFAHLEKTSPLDRFRNLCEKSTYKAVTQQAGELGVKEKLFAFTIATESVKSDRRQGTYHLIVLDYGAKKVMVQTYPRDEIEKANRDYTQVEKQIEKGGQLQAVLVSAGSLKKLRRAYPNYFLDTQEFLKQLNRIAKVSNA